MARRLDRGFTLVELIFVVAIIATLVAIAMPNFMESRKAANEVSAIGTLRTYLAEETRGCILPARTQAGYTFKVFHVDEYDWLVNADPVKPGKSGDRYFFVDKSGVIRFATSAPADAGSHAIGD